VSSKIFRPFHSIAFGFTKTKCAAIIATAIMSASAICPFAWAEDVKPVETRAADDSAISDRDLVEKTTGTTSGAVSETGKVIHKPGIPITVTMATEDLVPTDDTELAKKQVDAYPESAEAAFIYAVSLTRTSRVEDALKEIRRARRLAERDGGPVYLDKMINSYEEMLKTYPDENRVRYGLAWAYYMKAYLIARQSKKEQEYLQKLQVMQQQQKSQTATKDADKNAVALPQTSTTQASGASAPPWLSTWAAPYLPKDKDGKPISLDIKTGADAPHIKGALEQAAPSVVPQVKQYYQAALKNLDELLVRKPDDVWAKAYRAHLNAEYTGDLASSMEVWRQCAQQFPDNPAAYFFLGEGYLKQGNLKECLSNISRAIALRGLAK
jgi:tetratricopeptide (TPR) repeat protein